jgi:GT2 family glycosyltransferase
VSRIALPRSETPLASIVVVTERNPQYLEACLRRLAERLPAPAELPVETVIVLNAARPEVRDLVRQQVDGATVLDSEVRIGWAGGINLARTAVRGEFLVLLQDDTEIEPGWLEPLVEAARTEPMAGAVGSLVLHMDGTLQTPGRLLWRNGGTSPLWAIGENEQAPTAADFSERFVVDYTSSSSLLLRTASFDAIGGADENYFPVIYVDTDLGLSLRRLGEFVLVEPRSRVRHHWHGTTGGPTPFRHFLAERNRFYLARKFAAELGDFEPPAPESPAAVARARAQTARWAAAARAGTPPARPIGPPPTLDRERHARRALALEAALQRDWAAELERALAAERAQAAEASGRLAASEAAVARLDAALASRDRDLAAIAATRWWRLYQRLLPALRRIPFRSLSSSSRTE